MAEFELQEVNGSATAPVLPRPNTQPRYMDSDTRSALTAFMAEMDVYHQAIKGFHDQEPDEVLLQCSSFLGRLAEIRTLLYRNGSAHANQLRTREVDPMIHDLREQFAIHSRLQSIREADWKMLGKTT